MRFTATKLLGAYLLEPDRICDERGYFARTWCADELARHDLNCNLVQTNIGVSKLRGTLRGMHFQIAPHAEVKIIRCARGAIYDVIVDVRPDSPTYCQWLGAELSAENGAMLYVPEGFAHGYQTLADDSEMSYQTSHAFERQSARGVRYNDPAFAIQWPLPISVISAADQNWPLLTATIPTA